MMAKGLFPTYHPAVCMLFFLAAVGFSFCSMHPVHVGVSLVVALAYGVFLRGPRPIARMLAWCVPMVVFIALVNAAFSGAGATRLVSAGPVSMTLEGLAYGLVAGGMLASVLMWFACYNEVMTEDKFTFLFGRALPSLSLAVSMVSRWVPRMAARGRAVFDAQESLVGALDPTRRGALGRGVRMATVLAGLGLEDSIQTSDSMRARGFGVGRRTSYARYRWHARERVAVAGLVALVALNVVLMAAGDFSFDYYPRMSALEWRWGFAAFALLLAFPLLLELERVVRR